MDSTTWERVGEPAPWNEAFGAFDSAPDGTQFASVKDGAITLVDAQRGTVATIALPTPAPGARIAYLPDSRRLMVAGLEGSAWTVETRWQA